MKRRTSKLEARLVTSLSEEDLLLHPVWRFVSDDDAGELMVRPVTTLPVSSLANKVVGTRVRLANGQDIWALLGNVDAGSPRMTEHFLSVSVRACGEWFALARYHDPDYLQNGPDKLAGILGLRIDEVFPIRYDISAFAEGQVGSLVGEVRKEPREVLSREMLISLAVP